MTDLEFVAMQNSTAVRSPGLPLAARLVRPAFAALSVLAPALAASVAERVFLTAPRHRAPEHETAALAGARRTSVQVGGSPVSVWTCGHGPVGLLVHGWGGRGAQLARFVEPRLGLGLAWSALDVRGYAPAMRAPLLVVHDRDDAEVPWQDGAIIARIWPGAVFSTTGGLGHRRILRDPCVVRGVTAFVAERVLSGASACGREEGTVSAVA